MKATILGFILWLVLAVCVIAQPPFSPNPGPFNPLSIPSTRYITLTNFSTSYFNTNNGIITITGVPSASSPWTNSAGVVQLVNQTNLISVVAIVPPEYNPSQQNAWQFGVRESSQSTLRPISTGLYVFNYLNSTNYASFWWGDGAQSTAAFFEKSAADGVGSILAGFSSAITGLDDGDNHIHAGLHGVGYTQVDGQTNIGSVGLTFVRTHTGVFIGSGGIIGVNDNSISNALFRLSSSAGYFDNCDTGLPVLVGKTNGTNTFLHLGDGKTYIGATNAARVGISRVLSNTASLNFDLSAVTFQDLTIPVTGALPGDDVSLGIPLDSIANGVSYTGYASNDVVFVRASTSTGTPNPAAGTFRATVIQF